MVKRPPQEEHVSEHIQNLIFRGNFPHLSSMFVADMRYALAASASQSGLCAPPPYTGALCVYTVRISRCARRAAIFK